MRMWKVFLKQMREALREPLVLSLTLIFAPCFIVVYAMFFPSGSTSYTVLVLNQDAGAVKADGSTWRAGEQAIEAINSVTYPDGKPLLHTRTVNDVSEAEKDLRDRDGLVLITIPENFSSSLLELQRGSLESSAKIIFGGDLTNSYYIIAAIMATSAIEAYVQEVSGRPPLLEYIEKPLGGSASRTEFENYVPGLFVFAIVMLVFMASMTVAREVEAGTLRRLQITRLTSFEFLGGISLALLLVGIASELLTFAAAIAIGFRSQGPLWVAILVGILTSLSVIGAGLIVACFSRTVSQAFIIANFPLAFFMFFTGIIYPIPKIGIFSIGGRVIGLFDILPPTHAVAALNKIFTLGANFQDVLFELSMLCVLSLVYFFLGVLLFHKRHMSIS